MAARSFRVRNGHHHFRGRVGALDVNALQLEAGRLPRKPGHISLDVGHVTYGVVLALQSLKETLAIPQRASAQVPAVQVQQVEGVEVHAFARHSDRYVGWSAWLRQNNACEKGASTVRIAADNMERQPRDSSSKALFNRGPNCLVQATVTLLSRIPAGNTYCIATKRRRREPRNGR